MIREKLFTPQEILDLLRPHNGYGDEKVFLTTLEAYDDVRYPSYTNGPGYGHAVRTVLGREPDLWVSTDDYQGDHWVLAFDGGTIYYMCIGYGSCSG